MPVSLLLAQEIAKLFLILLLGVAVVRAGLLHAADSRVLSVILVYLIVPCVILNAFQIEDTPELRAGLLFALGAGGADPRRQSHPDDGVPGRHHPGLRHPDLHGPAL